MKHGYIKGILSAFMVMGGIVHLLAASHTNAPVLPPIIDYLSPQDEVKTFSYQDGYRLELVLSDPIIKEPVLTVFDGNGRMFVAEMRSYMQDIDGTNQRQTNGRVSMHWSSKHNGVFDKHSVFVDHLVLPRMVLPLAAGVVINETDSDDYWLYRDTKGTGVADKKELFYSGGPRGGNLEHQPSGLIWDMDNWLYITVNAYRLRLQGTNVIRQNIVANNAQWGFSQDNYGKPWIMNAGYEAGPINFQAPFLYGIFTYEGQFEDDFMTVWPLIGLADVQGGTVRFRPENKSLNHFTATCGGEIYRGDRLPADLQGDFIFAEPVGRLIRRSKVEVREGFTYLRNPYPKSEFIRSTDPDFRPVSLVNAPDGTLYITDMYRGIIQERDWVNQGSYLRGVVEKYQMDKNVGRGRIWRLVNKAFKPGPQPHMLNESAARLVTHLEHPSGWWRDTAQKLLVLRGDKSVVPALITLARTSTNHLARIHALWTLEGLDALTPSFVREKLKDPHPQVRLAAIRASETLYGKGDHSLVPDIAALAHDPDANVVVQVMLTANLLQWPDWQNLIATTTAANPAYGVKRMGTQMVPPPSLALPATAPTTAPVAHLPPSLPASHFTADEKGMLARGEIIYKQLCFVCHGFNGQGTPFAGAGPGVTMAPPLSGSQTATGYRDGIISIVLKGLSGPVAGKKYDAQMVPMESNDDDWVASVISYIRNNFGNHSTFVSSNEVAFVRAAINGHTNAWTLQELHDTLPQPIPNRKAWKLTASHNPASLPAAIDGNLSTGYNTGTPQTPGMWVQVELPQTTLITGVELDAGTARENYPLSYRIELSGNGQSWRSRVNGGHASAVRNQIIFPPTPARFVRITQTGLDATHSWSINELQLLKVPTSEELLQPPDLFPPAEPAGSSAQPEVAMPDLSPPTEAFPFIIK